MNKPMFYRRQIGPNIFYFLGLWFFGLMALSCLVLPPILFYIEPIVTPSEAIAFLLMFIGFFGFFLAFFLYIKVKIGGRRKKIYKKFRQLSEAEQTKVNAELSGKIRQIHWGESRLYTGAGFFWEFVDYDDIAWVYGSSTATPTGEDTQVMVLSVKIHDTQGMMYKIPTTSSYDTERVIESVMTVAPNVIFGYSKERARLAKKDFNRFLLEGRKNAE
ncbi:MAG: hypothetical protein FWC76_03805 [Defluviitaleaceae bacterium]|nr:hypothetical protein [Defluviitaleaceae bacterium]